MLNVVLTPSKSEFPDRYQPVTVWDGQTPTRALLPKLTARTLIALLDLAGGNRVVGVAGSDIAQKIGAHTKSVQRVFTELAKVGFIATLETASGVRRVHLITPLDSFAFAKLPSLWQTVLRALYELGNGRKTFNFTTVQLARKTGLSGRRCGGVLLYLAKAGAIEEPTPGSSRVNLYRIDVKRGRGAGLQLIKLSTDVTDVEPVSLVPARERAEPAAHRQAREQKSHDQYRGRPQARRRT